MERNSAHPDQKTREMPIFLKLDTTMVYTSASPSVSFRGVCRSFRADHLHWEVQDVVHQNDADDRAGSNHGARGERYFQIGALGIRVGRLPGFRALP
jgi:hypothetical protein